MSQDKFDILIQKYQNDELAGAEKKLMDQWFDSLESEQSHRWTEGEVEDLKRRIMAVVEKERSASIRPIWFKKWLPYAAAILLFVAFGSVYYVYFHQDTVQVPMLSDTHMPLSQEDDVAPGRNRAILTLTDGTTVALSESQEAIVVAGGEIKYENGRPLFDKDSRSSEAKISFAELSIPRGGQYQITLPDGSKVWLNSASILKYPLQFGDQERVVELEGEAYFEIAAKQTPSGKRVPFRIITAHQSVDVLGTRFNISAYADEADTRTTLVSGQVRVAKSGTDQTAILKPGEEAVVRSSSDIYTRPANIDAAIAWKSGIFHFDETPFPQMLKQIARWYDIDVVYEGVQPKDVFSGKMSRNVNLQVLVKFLRDSGIRLQIEGKKLIVKNKN